MSFSLNCLKIKYEELLERTQRVESKREAELLLDVLVWLYCQIHDTTEQAATQFIKSNIAYNAGYFDNRHREIIEYYYDCEHPIFGKYAILGKPTAHESFQCGYQNKTLAEIRQLTHEQEQHETPVISMYGK